MTIPAPVVTATGPDLFIPSGKKRRLYGVAINTGFGRPDADLRGCLTDRDTGTAWAVERGHDEVNYIPEADADLPNVLDHLWEGALKTRQDDALIIHIPSHGALSRAGRGLICLKGCLTAPDFEAACLSGSQFREIAGSIAAGAFVAAILDVCHAFASRALNPHYSRPRFLPHPDQGVARQSAILANENYVGTGGAFAHFGMVHDERGIVVEELLWDVFLYACGRSETAADAYLNGRYCGAWSTAIFAAMTPGKPVADAVAEAHAAVKAGGFAQNPGVDAGHYHRARSIP